MRPWRLHRHTGRVRQDDRHGLGRKRAYGRLSALYSALAGLLNTRLQDGLLRLATGSNEGLDASGIVHRSSVPPVVRCELRRLHHQAARALPQCRPARAPPPTPRACTRHVPPRGALPLAGTRRWPRWTLGGRPARPRRRAPQDPQVDSKVLQSFCPLLSVRAPGNRHPAGVSAGRVPPDWLSPSCLQHPGWLRRPAGEPSLSRPGHPCPRPQAS